MNVVAHAVQIKAGWVPQIRYMSAEVDRLSRGGAYVDGEVIWEYPEYELFETAQDAVAVAQARIDLIVRELFA